MKRRKNFLLGSTSTHEVRVYPYGKKNVRDDRNVKVRKFSGLRAAMDWAKVNLAYPEVEVVDLTSGRTVFAGGTGKTFNPRKKRKAPKRRDVYAEMAKSRKTTKGHKRKDRKRSVARGSSRKPKHKIRLNPFEYEKPNLGAKVFDANVKKRQSKILGMYRGFLAALGSAGVKKLPSAGEIRDDAMQGAVLIESTRYPELRSQSKEAGGAQAVAAEVLGVGPGGEFAAYVQDYPEIFELHLKDTVELLKKERVKLRAAERKDAKRIDKAREDFTQERATSKAAKIAAIEAKIAAKKSEIADYGDEDYEDEDEGELDPQTAAELAEVYEMTPGEEAEEEQLQEDAQREKAVKKGRKKRKKTVEYVEGEYVSPIEGFSKEKMERLGKYVHDLSPVRRTDVQPPLNLLGKTRQDVLLYVLKDGTTQVWMKGSMTVTFEPTVKLPSWTIAHRYANRWRGLSPSGSVRGAQKEGEPPVKKSRLRTAVYAAVEGQDKLKKLEDPINIVEKRDRKLKRKKYDMPDLDKYELIGDRANPVNWIAAEGTFHGWTYAQWEAHLKRELKSIRYPHSWADFKNELRSRTQSADEALRGAWINGVDPTRFLEAHADEMRYWGGRANPSARQRKKTKQKAGQWIVAHADHGINRKQMAYIKKFLSKSAPQGFFIKQFRFPKSQGLGTIPNAMWGPESGDRPVPESEVHYKERGDRPWTDRMIDRPPRPVNYGQVLGIRDGNSFHLFTVYGGPLAPLNPADPDNHDVAGAKRFWKKHALSSHQWAKANPRRRKNSGVFEDWPSQIGAYQKSVREYEAGAVDKGWPSNIKSIVVYGPWEIEYHSGYVDFAGMGRHSQGPSWEIEKDGKYYDRIYDSTKKEAIRKVRSYIKESAGRIRAVARRKNPRRRKNTWLGEEGPKLTWKDWCAGIRSELRAYRSGGTTRTWRGQKSWSMEDFKAEVSRLYRKPADEILKELWRDDPTDPAYFVEGCSRRFAF